ncbi:hypothetical protein NPC53_001526 [Shigella flexneri]|nr:hypothetical protein [Shigella flexneri]
MKSVKEVVRKALLNNGTKDDMYKDIVAEFGCSRHAAKVLLHSFIWECSEAYMVHAAFSESNLQADKDLLKPHDLREDNNQYVGRVYVIKHLPTDDTVGTIKLIREIEDLGFEGDIMSADMKSIFGSYGRWLVGYDGFITADYKRSDYKIDLR